MEQSATAPVLPAANGIVVPKTWQALMCAIVLQTAISNAHAEERFPDIDNTQAQLQASLLASARTQSMVAELHFSPDQISPPAKPVKLSTIRMAPVTKPRETVTPLPPSDRAGLKPTLIFGSLGKSVSLSPVTRRWQRALNELGSDHRKSNARRHEFRAYSAILDQVQPIRRGLQIPKVNYMVNRLLSYREDSSLWNTGEYWASPVETLQKRAGDCEDYAILKYALLRDLGVEDQDMRIVVLRDTAARQYHAVLSVRHNGKWLILDNRFSRIRFERDLPHYQPLYSVNAAGEWSHVPRKGNPIRLAARLKSATR
ncbi:MAG: transglutaminase-like cysteine peptidase [Pseudomonadota bacterium]